MQVPEQPEPVQPRHELRIRDRLFTQRGGGTAPNQRMVSEDLRPSESVLPSDLPGDGSSRSDPSELCFTMVSSIIFNSVA